MDLNAFLLMWGCIIGTLAIIMGCEAVFAEYPRFERQDIYLFSFIAAITIIASMMKGA